MELMACKLGTLGESEHFEELHVYNGVIMLHLEGILRMGGCHDHYRACVPSWAEWAVY